MQDQDDSCDSDEMSANLFLDSTTRSMKLEIVGSAAFILTLLLDGSETSVMTKLWTEAKFDQLVKHGFGEMGE